MEIVKENESNNGDYSRTSIDAYYTFSGSVIEVMSQFVNHSFESFRFLLKSYPGFYDPFTTLFHFIRYHGMIKKDRYTCDNDVNSDCLIRTLLKVKVKPNPSGYRVTPLQITITAWDLKGIQLLLKYGADPEGIKDLNRFIYSHTSPKFKFNKLYGKSPL
jgi:hypothetical protein